MTTSKNEPHSILAVEGTGFTKINIAPLGIHIRRGRISDFPNIRRMVRHARLIPIGLIPERFVIAEIISQNGYVDVVGFVQLKPMKKKTDVELASLVVDERMRGKGIARLLLKTLLDGVERKNVYVRTFDDVRPFFEKFGFSRCSKNVFSVSSRLVSSMMVQLRSTRSGWVSLVRNIT